MADGEAPLYTAEQGVRHVAGWVAVWAVAHYACWTLWQKDLRCACSMSQVKQYRRRLCRSQVYCALASIGGADLLSRCSWDPHSLLYDFTPQHQLLFSMAAGHWIVSIWEDALSWNFLKGGLRTAHFVENYGIGNPDAIFGQAYLAHHVVAATGFTSILLQRACTGIGTFGLLFELPVLLMNHRDFAVYADRTPRWFRDPRHVDRFWELLDILFAVGRILPFLVYLYSLAFWWDDLKTLPSRGRYMYHGMAIFFTIINYLLKTHVLAAWASSDRAASRSARAGEEASAACSPEAPRPRAAGPREEEEEEKEEPAVAGPAAQLSMQKDEETGHGADPPIERPVSLVMVPEGFLEEDRPADNAEGEVWIEIDSIAYDVTPYLKKHPGGEAVLRKYSGKDASEAFHKVRHSMNARVLMNKYAVGPIMKPKRMYRLFEHSKEVREVTLDMLRVAVTYGVAAFCTARSAVVAAAALPPARADAESGAFLIPGLLLSASMGWMMWLAVGPSTLLGRTSGSLGGTCGLSLCMVLHCVGLVLARQPFPDGIPPASPTGVELSVVLSLALEEAYELYVGSPGWTWRIVAAVVPWGLGWSLRGAPEPFGNLPEHGLAAALLAGSMFCLLRRVGGAQLPKEQKADEVLRALALAGPLSTLALACLAVRGPAVSGCIRGALSSSGPELVCLVLAPVAMIASFLLIANQAFMVSPAWSARLWAIVVGYGVCAAGGLSSWRWLSWVAGTLYLETLGARVQVRFDMGARDGTFVDEHPHVVGARGMWDLARLSVVSLWWQCVLQPAKFVVNTLMPEELRAFGMAIPFFDLGNNVDLGVAAYYAPPGAVESEEAPKHFVCNVGHVDMKHPRGMADFQQTMNALRDVWTEFKNPSVKGLVANVVFIFPRLIGTTFAKEINMSAWHSADDARNWYEGSAGHKNVLRKHSSGGLGTFGNMLATLEPSGGVRHQDRCSKCARLIDGGQLGKHAPSRCETCGGEAYGYPFI